MGTVSVVIPVRNGAHEISGQLDALCAQTDSDFELIVSDNGSTDNLKEILASYDGRLKLRWVDASAQRGVSYARNAGARASNTDYIMICDADDMVSPQWVEKFRAALDANPEALYSGSLKAVVGVEGKNASSLTPQESLGEEVILLGATSFCGGNCAISRKLWEQNEGFREGFVLGGAEDVDFAVRLERLGYGIYYVAEAEILYVGRSTRWQAFKQGRGYGRGQVQLWLDYGESIKAVNLRHSFVLSIKLLPKLFLVRRSESLGYSQQFGINVQIVLSLMNIKINNLFLN